MHKLIIRLALVLLLAPAISVSQAATDLTVYSGKIDSVKIKASKIVIDDSLYYLAPNYSVQNIKGDTISAFSLKTGRSIEYRVNKDNQIKEIIILR